MQRFRQIFAPHQLKLVEDLPLYDRVRHPTWFPLFYQDRTRDVDELARDAVPRILAETGGKAWLDDLVPKLLDTTDLHNASSSLVEIRAYGGLLEAGFTVTPIRRTSSATPDFSVDAGDGPMIVEVAGKHQDKQQDMLAAAMVDPNSALPDGVSRSTRAHLNRTVTITTGSMSPGGAPDPKKAHDSVQANVISRVCGIKNNEKQISEDLPALLIADFTYFGHWIAAQMLELQHASPLMTGFRGPTSGGMWYGFYGWRDAPIFEGFARQFVRLQHDGRFRMTGNAKSKLSAALVVFAQGVVLLENPWAAHPLTPAARQALTSYPRIDLGLSVANWAPGDALATVNRQEADIRAAEKSWSYDPGA
jgi:hypothetical protein